MKFRSNIREASVAYGKLATSGAWLHSLDNQSELNGNNRNLNYDNQVRGIAHSRISKNMDEDLYSEIYDFSNLYRAWKKAKKHKTKRDYVIEFGRDLPENLYALYTELRNRTYAPAPLKSFVLCDPKTRKICKSSFRDRVVHHALIGVIGNTFDKGFIYDSCANRIDKGNLFALERFDKFKRKVTNNLKSEAFCLKADIRHYFEEVNHSVLIGIIERKIFDKNVMGLIMKILNNSICLSQSYEKGMPLGNLTSQFFANVYLNELDYFAKHRLRARYYIRYVDDFVIFHRSKEQLETWKKEIANFLKEHLKLELHPEKSRIMPLSRGVDFVGFRNFYHYRLLRKRNMRKIRNTIRAYRFGELSREKLLEKVQGWQAYARWANTCKFRQNVTKLMQENR